MDFENSWNNHRLSEIEAAIKDKIGQLEDTLYDINYVNIEGKTNRAFSELDNEIKVQFTVNHVINGLFINYVEYSVYIGTDDETTLFYNDSAEVNDEHTIIETRDLKNRILQVNANRVKVVLNINGKEKILYYSRYIASLDLADNNLYYNCDFLQFRYQVTEGANAELHLKVDNVELPLITLNTETVTYNWNTSDLAQGPHKVEAYISLNTNLLYSNTVYTQIVVGVPQESSIVYFIDNVPKVNTTFQLVYLAYNETISDNDKFNVELYDENDILLARSKVSHGATNSFTIDIYNTNNRYTIVIPEQVTEFNRTISGTSVEITFTANTDGINWTIPILYEAAWEANNGSYSILTEDKKWKDKTGKYYILLPYNTIFGAYGFGNEYRHAMNQDDSPDGNYLTLGYNYKISSNFKPFYDTTPQAGGRGGGILSTGCTFSITFKKRQSPNAPFYIINDSSIQINIIKNELIVKVGKYNLYQASSTTADRTATNYNLIPNGTKVNLIVTIAGLNTSNSSGRYISVYINGELSARQLYDETQMFLNNSGSFLNTFNNNYLDVYNIYYYKRCLNDMLCLELANIVNKTGESAIEKYTDNNFYNQDGSITLDKGIAYGLYKAPITTDFAVVACTDFRTDLDTSGTMHNTSSFDNLNPQYFYLYRFTVDEFNKGIIDPERTFMVTGTGGHLRIRRQGTTTALEPTANIRVDITGECSYYKWNSDKQQFEFDRTIGDGEKIWEIRDSFPCKVLTMKHNPNESTQSRNLPTSRWYELCARELASDDDLGEKYRTVLTPPQIREVENSGGVYSKSKVRGIRTRQAIDGIPGIGFLISRPLNANSSLIAKPLTLVNSFAGQYDLITDKTNADVFGFGSDSSTEDYSIEFRNNSNQVLNFLRPLVPNDTLEGHKTAEGDDRALEYRYPSKINGKDAYTDYHYDEDLHEYVGSIGLEPNSPLVKLFDFVCTCNDTEAENVIIKVSAISALNALSNKNAICKDLGFEDYNDALTLMLVDEGEGNTYICPNTESYRRLKFRTELMYYCVVPQICLNGLLVEWGLLIDQDTKNQFFTHFKGDEVTIDGVTYPLLRLLAYDMDTSWGVDNLSYISHNPWELYEDGLYDGGTYVNEVKVPGTTNKFWALVYACFKLELNEIAVALQKEVNGSLLTYSTLKSLFFENHIDVYNELIYNSNALFSYVTVPADNRDVLLKKIHGSDRLTTDTFLKERCIFLLGKYFSVNYSRDYKNICTFFTEYHASEVSSSYTTALARSRKYLPMSLYSVVHKKKDGEEYVINNDINNGNAVALVDLLSEELKKLVEFPNAVIIYSTQSKSSNIKARGWYRYTIKRGNTEELVDSNFLDYIENARTNNVNYYPSHTFFRYVYNTNREVVLGAKTGFVLKTPPDIGTAQNEGGGYIEFRVYGPFIQAYETRDFQILILHSLGVLNSLDDDPGVNDYPAFSTPVSGLYHLGLKNIYSLIDNKTDNYGTSNITNIPSTPCLLSIPDNTHVTGWHFSSYMKNNTTYGSDIVLLLVPPLGNNSSTYTPKLNLDLRKPIRGVNNGGGYPYINRIYCYAQGLPETNMSTTLIDDVNYSILVESNLRNDVLELDFRMHLGTAVELSNRSSVPEEATHEHLHYGYPSSCWALVPLLYISNLSSLSNINNFTWINGTPEEPILTHAYYNLKESGYDEFFTGKYIKIEGSEVLVSDEPAEGYTLFNWYDDTMIANLRAINRSYYTKSKVITKTAFTKLLAFDSSSMDNLKVLGYIKINDNSIQLSSSECNLLLTKYPDLHIMDSLGRHLTDNRNWTTRYF